MTQIQRQKWHDYTRYVIFDTSGGSVQLELYPEIQKFGGTAFIYALWVDKSCRRRGMAKRLLDRAEGIAKQEGHEAVMLEWELKDTPIEILEWYKRRGYVISVSSGHGNYARLIKLL